MAKNGVDLNALRTEIDSRKKQRGDIAESVQGAKLLPKDVFLNELKHSFNTGQETKATTLIKMVENKTAERNGETSRLAVNETAPARVVSNNAPRQPQRLNEIDKMNEVEMSPERDELLYQDLDRRRKSTLADSISQYVGAGVGQQPQQQYPNQQPQMNLNEGYLVENVKKVVDNYLIENFGPVVEEAIKSTILELYAVERIKEVLHENKEMIKSLIFETIKEIQVAQAKKKAQAQQ